MNKKIVSLIIALTLPVTFLVGCKKSSPKEENFTRTEGITAFDGNIEYSAESYKDAYFSTENYSAEYLQKEFESIVNEITAKKDREELVKLLNAYSNGKDSSLDIIKSIYNKHNNQDENSTKITLNSNGMYEISSRLYKATLNGTKKQYDINDFYIYYKDQLINSSTTTDEEKFENEVKMTTIKEYTIATIYKNAYNDSFISKTIASLNETTVDDEKVDNTQVSTEEDDTEETSNSTDKDKEISNSEDQNTENTENTDEDLSDKPLELTEALKSQIYDAGVQCAIEFVGLNDNSTTASSYCKDFYDNLENDNYLGDNKEEGYNSFLEGFKTTLQNNGIEFN